MLQKSTKRPGKRGAKLDGRRLHRVAMNDGRVFKQRSEALSINAAVHISLDISASMGPRMELAREAVLALMIALKQINGVTMSASAYPGDSDNGVFEILTQSNSAQKAASVLTALNGHDSTPMATGLWHSVHQVFQVKTERKLILMITDGGPDRDHYKTVVDLAGKCQASEIDVVGVDINTPISEELLPSSVIIDHLNQLKLAMFGLICFCNHFLLQAVITDY